jgi:hypothetical protein
MQVQINGEYPVCPVCGRRAFIFKDNIGGIDFGYSIYCPYLCKNPIGGRLSVYAKDTVEECLTEWRKKTEMIKKYKENRGDIS